MSSYGDRIAPASLRIAHHPHRLLPPNHSKAWTFTRRLVGFFSLARVRPIFSLH